MAFITCETKYSCTALSFIASLIIGIIAAFLQITGVITLAPIVVTVAFGIAIVYLAITLLAAALSQKENSCKNCCSPLATVLFGNLGTILFAAILSIITFAATSVIGAIFVGALFFFFSLLIASTACLIKCLTNCNY